MNPTLRMASILILTVIGWELLKLAVKSVFSVEYYRRESPTVVIKIKVMPWDIKGKKHFEEQGYTREFPADADPTEE